MKTLSSGVRRALAVTAIGLAAALFAAPAWATFAMPIPEPESIGVFLAGLGAIVIALRLWHRR
jgi:hypothetical protein